LSSEFIDTGTKLYTIRQLDSDARVLSESNVEAPTSEAAAKQLRDVVNGTDRIEVCLGGEPMNEMGVDYWRQRMRRR